ncbi:MAG: hypothetical protein B7Y99_12590, partial [Caulobacterales bacterium 32-69-10]
MARSPLRQVVEALRAQARSSAFEFDGRTLANLRRLFARPLPWPPHDFAALTVARALGDAMAMDPARGRRILKAAAAQGALPYVVIGDSHSRHLIRRSARDGRWLLPVHFLCTGSSARGLANPASLSGWNHRVAALLSELAEADSPIPVLFEFGQVDVEFVFTFKRLSEERRTFEPDAFSDFVRGTVDSYLGFLAGALPERLKPFATVVSIFPSSLSDAAWRQGYINAHIADLHGEANAVALSQRLRAIDIPHEAARTAQHRLFNAALAAGAAARGLRFLDIFSPLIGDLGTVHRPYRGLA